MAQGDTTVRIDFEVGGTSAARMAILDIYKSQKEGQNKVTNAAKAFAAENNMTYRDAMRALKQHLRNEQNELSKAEGKQNAEQAKRESAAQSLQAQRSRYLIANYEAEQREKKRLSRQSELDMKRLAREEIREAKAVAREKARLAKMEDGQKGIGSSIMSRGIRAGILGIAGYAGVAGVSNIISGLTQGAQQFIDKRQELEKAIAPIVMLEDNVSNMSKIRQEVSGTAVALGRSYEEVGNFYSELIGTTGNLTSGERDQLVNETKELAQLTGGSLVTAQNLLTKSYQIYGKELVNVNQLQNKLMMTQDQASITFEEMGQRLPEVLQAGQLAGVSLDDVLATTIGATRRSGSIEKTMTGQRNFYLIIEEAQKKGITLTGTYTEKVQQLANMFATNKDKMMGLFDREVVIHAKGITDAIKEITQASKELGGVTGETDMVFDKLLKKSSELGNRQAQTFKSYEDSIANAANFAPDVTADTPTMKVLEQFKAGEMAYKVATGGVLPDWWNAFAGGTASMLVPGFAAEGREMMISKQSMPDFIASKRVDFFRKKENDLWKIDVLRGTIPGFSKNEDVLKYRKEISDRQLSPHLMTEEERRIFKETGQAPQSAAVVTPTSASQSSGSGSVEDTKTHELLAEIRDRLPSDGGKTVAKPGGGKTNSEEAI